MITPPRRGGPLYRAARSRTNLVAVLLRTSACALIAVVYLVEPTHSMAGWVVFGALFAWAAGRTAIANRIGWIDAFDVVVVVAFIAIEPLVSTPTSAGDASMMLVIPLTVSFTSQLPMWLSYPTVMGMLGVESLGALLGEGHRPESVAIFAVIIIATWAVTAWMRRLVLRSLRASDEADSDVHAAQLAGKIATARRRYERDQWSLVHDTAAATLLMVAQGRATDRARLAAQAAEDLAGLAGLAPGEAMSNSADLGVQLRDAAAEFDLAVTFEGLPNRRVPARVGRAVVTAARDVLATVERHASGAKVSVELTENRVSIVDGSGTVVSTDSLVSRLGLRSSIVARMKRAGGDVTVSRPPTGATIVELTWTDEAPLLATPPTPTTRLPMALARGFNLAVAIIGLFVPVASFTGLSVRSQTWAGQQLMLLAVTCIAGIIAMALVFWRSDLVTVLASVAVVAVGPLSVLATPDGENLYEVNWALGATTWTLTALLWRYRLNVSLPIVVVAWLLQLGTIFALDPSREIAAAMGYVVVTGLVTQCATLSVLRLVGDAATQARRAERGQRIAAVADSVSDALQDDYDRRLRNLSESVVPLLTGFAQQTLDPADPQVQARAGAEAQLLHRMFAHAEVFEQRLLQDLRPAIDAAEQRGVAITLDIGPDLPERGEDQVHTMAQAVTSMIDRVQTAARLVVLAVNGELSVDLVGDLSDDVADDPWPGLVFSSAKHRHVTWVQVREQPASVASEMSPAQ